MNKKMYEIHQYLNKHCYVATHIRKSNYNNESHYELYKCSCGYYNYARIDIKGNIEMRNLTRDKDKDFIHSIFNSLNKKERELLKETLYLNNVPHERICTILSLRSKLKWKKITGH